MTCLASDKPSLDWKAFTPEELTLKESATYSGVGAIVLDWEVFRDDQENFATFYGRIKLFSDAGKDNGNIEIPFVKDVTEIKDIQARTIHADGTIIPFTGSVFEKTIVKSRQIRYLAKTFSMPDVQSGSILEYRYRVTWGSSKLFDSHWDLQQHLPVRHERFQIRPYSHSSLRWYGTVPGGKPLVKGDGNVFTLELADMPPYNPEAYSPPERETKAEVDLYYFRSTYSDTNKFWEHIGTDWAEWPDSFVGNRGFVHSLAASLVQPNDPPETKLRKLYVRVQQIRNLTYEHQLTSEEIKQAKLKDNSNVEDVVKHNWGFNRSINLVYLGLVRAAGFEAHEVALSPRRDRFFHPEIEDSGQLTWNVVEVKVGDQYRYFDPGTKYCPFGLLHWTGTGVAGLRLQKEGGVLIKTPDPVSDAAIVERKATIHWSEEATKGELTVTYRGQEALIKRLTDVLEDDNERRKDLEDEAKAWLPAASTVKLNNVTGWQSTDEPLVATFVIEIPNFGVSTAQRLILPLDIFSSRTHPAFQYDKRKFPVYFSYPY
ncbi:MAG TPA: DUF3857 domain-containing protein, partial [Blastocatellia bacterium]|nr:DUF3857 domain-containing protein [Blastocatellia bacterium]